MHITSLPQFQPTSRNAAARPAAAQQAASSTPGDSVVLGQSQPAPAKPAIQPQPAAQPQPQVELKDWTVLIYSVSDNNLYDFMQADLDEAERVGSTGEMNVLVETSHQPRGGSVVRMKLETDQTPGLTSPVLEDLGPNHNMAKSDSMANSIAWAMKEYPSKHFMVIISDHGGGWTGTNHSESQHSWMSLNDVSDAFNKAEAMTGKKVDVIGWDQCLMASMEVAHQLKDNANFMVGSEEVEGGAGWQYDEALPGAKQTNTKNRVFSGQVLNYAAAALRARDPLTPKDMAKGIVQMAEGHQRDLGTMSAIDLTKVPALSEAVDAFAGAVLASGLTSADFAPVKAETQKFYEFADMGHFIKLAGDKFGGEIKEASDKVLEALDSAVVANQSSSDYPNAMGLNIEINKDYGMQGGGGQGDILQMLMQLVGSHMSPEQVQQLLQAMPALVEMLLGSLGGGGAAEMMMEQDGPRPAKYPVPNMDPDKARSIDFLPYEEIQFTKDTRWFEMLQQVG